ncbi:DUF2071 domain-containing protein [soil metagenome]
MAIAFLSAQWRNLILITWSVPPELLRAIAPRGIEPDVRAGRAFVSFVAFDFRDTRVLSVPWPGHIRFPEANLRYYVRQGKRRGVCFVREYVPKPLIAMVARWGYNEQYATAAMDFRKGANGDGEIALDYQMKAHGASARIRVVSGAAVPPPASNSLEHFFKEHEWGYGRFHSGHTLMYRVRHPHWRVHPIKKIDWEIDFAGLYGEEWGFLEEQKPFSAIHAEGSPVTVSFPRILWQ